MSRTKKLELIGLLLWNIPAFFLSAQWGGNYLVEAFFFFAIPAIYVSLRSPKIIEKVCLVSWTLVIPMTIIVDYFAHNDGSWYDFSIIGLRFFHSYPVDDFLWGFIYFYYIMFVYEYFFERERIFKTPKKFLSFEICGLAAAILFFLLLGITGTRLTIPFFYMYVIGILFLLIPGLIFFFHPRVLRKACYAGAFFLLPSFLYEYIANSKKSWLFPGTHFIARINFFGFMIPIEELLWLLFAASAVVAYYEFIADDDR